MTGPVTHRDVARAPGGIRFVLVGQYQIVTDQAVPGKVIVRDNKSGEAMQADARGLEHVVRKFFRDHF